MNCAIGVLAAVTGAKTRGEGACVDAAMLDGALALRSMTLASLRGLGRTQPGGRNLLTGAFAQ